MSGGGCSGPASPEGGGAEHRRIYDPLEALAAGLARLEEINRAQLELSEAREKTLRARLLQAEASRERWKTAYIELPLLANPKIAELQEIDLEDSRSCEAPFHAGESEQEIQHKGSRNCLSLSQSNADHTDIARDLTAQLSKLKQACETLCSSKDKEASEAAQKFQQNIEELQVAAQKRDDEIARLRAQAVDTENKETSQKRRRDNTQFEQCTETGQKRRRGTQLEQRTALDERRKGVFDQLLARYRSGQADYLGLKGRFEAQSVELERYNAAIADPTKVEGLKGCVAELERQLGERETKRGQAAQERDRLRHVEIELNEIVRRMTSDATSLKAAHLKELETLTEARRVMEEELQLKYEKVVGELQSLTEGHQRQLHALDQLIAESWPGTQDTAAKAVLEHRQIQRQEGMDVQDSDPWAPEDVVIAARARVPLLKGLVLRFQDGVLQLGRHLWPAGDSPDSPDTIPKILRLLAAAPRRVDAWRASAARAGAELALEVVLSWYPDVSLDQLSTLRMGSEDELMGLKDAISNRASFIASYASHDEFFPARDENSAEVHEAGLIELEQSDSSSDDDGSSERRPIEGIDSLNDSSDSGSESEAVAKSMIDQPAPTQVPESSARQQEPATQ